MKSVSCFILPCTLLTLSGCRQSSLLKKRIDVPLIVYQDISLDPGRVILTIWVHGTRFFKSHTFTTYFNDTPALKPVSLVGPDTHFACVAHTLNSFYPQQFPLEHFYIFGWSGKLDDHEREKSAHILHNDLKKLIAFYKNKHGDVFVRVLTHSHGGNLVLYLAKYNPDFVIDELILMGCPVQANTMDYTKHAMFKQVFSLYSSLDYVQVIAPQIYRTASGKPNRKSLQFLPISDKRFPAHKRLMQAKIKVNGHSLWHGSFVRTDFLTTLPAILASLKEWNTTIAQHKKVEREQLLCVYQTC